MYANYLMVLPMYWWPQSIFFLQQQYIYFLL